MTIFPTFFLLLLTIVSGSGLSQSDNTFKNRVFWKLDGDKSIFVTINCLGNGTCISEEMPRQFNRRNVEFSNNFIDGPCDSIPYELKVFIKGNKNSLDDSMNGRFVKSLICRAKNGTRVELWKINEFHNNGPKWFLVDLAMVIIVTVTVTVMAVTEEF